MTGSGTLGSHGCLEIPVAGGRSFEAGAALVKWFADMGAEVRGVDEISRGVEVRLSLGSTALTRIVESRRRAMIQRNRRWNASVREGCSATAARIAEMRETLGGVVERNRPGEALRRGERSRDLPAPR
jgi:hypothetical protein